MAGYGHPMSFKAITDEHIVKIEQFIREKSLQILHKNLSESINKENNEECEVLLDDEEMRDYFGDLYAQNPTEFQFEAGDVLLIKELVDHVKTISDHNGKNTGLGHFGKQNKKIRATKNGQHGKTALSLLKNKKRKDAAHFDENQLKIELQQKAMTCFNLYAGGTDFGFVRLEQVVVELKMEKEKIYGEIFCLFCGSQNKKNKKFKRVCFNSSKGAGCWILSNLTNHFEVVHHLKAQVNTKPVESKVECSMKAENSINDVDVIDCTEQIVENVDENGNESVIILGEFPKRNTKCDDPEQLYTQLSTQITKVTAAILQNGDEVEEITFTLNKSPKKLSVAVIPGDGSCMFGALAHQLFMNKITDQKHAEAKKKLRADVIEHILVNFSLFEHHLKDRVYEIKKRNEITDMSMECKLFVRHVLSNAKTWGGVETLFAVSNLYSTNIVVFNEEGICTKYKKADANYNRTIAVAHRIGLNKDKIRNHYDSVFEANAADLLSVAQYIAK